MPPRKRWDWAETARLETRYTAIRELAAAFVGNKLPLVCVMGPPGLGKSQIFKAAMKAVGGLYIRPGNYRELDMHIDLFRHVGKPITIDDTGLSKACREKLKALCETDIWRPVNYHTDAAALKEGEGRPRTPKSYWTNSPVAVLTNSWDSNDVIYRALESRGTLRLFLPEWAEVYKYIGSWFYDQEIYDYLYTRLGNLKPPDTRIVVRAYMAKVANLKDNDWREEIDNHLQDREDFELRRLLADSTYPTNTARQVAWCNLCRNKDTGEPTNAATFYRHLRALKASPPFDKPPRITLALTKRPDEQRPLDSCEGLDEVIVVSHPRIVHETCEDARATTEQQATPPSTPTTARQEFEQPIQAVTPPTRATIDDNAGHYEPDDAK